MKEKILLIGCGGHARSIIDTIESLGTYEICGFVANEYNKYKSYKVIGTDDDLQSIYSTGVHNAFICIGYFGNENKREALYCKLKSIGYNLPIIIDSTANIAKDAEIGEGTFVGKNVIVNANSYVGKMVILNTASIIEHDCYIGDFTHISVNSVICGGCEIKDNVFVGANTTIIQGVHIGSGSIIGAGSVILNNVMDGIKLFNKITLKYSKANHFFEGGGKN